MLRPINVTAAIIVLVCFFMPWVQVSCGGAKDSLTGVDLARHDDALLWLVPVLMLAVLSVAMLRAWKERPQISSVISASCAAVVALLMNRQRLRVHDESGVITAQLTGWFWLAFIATGAIILNAIAALLRRTRAG